VTLHGVRTGVVEVRDGSEVLATLEHHGAVALCPDCPSDGYWTVDGRGHHHAAVSAFRAALQKIRT